MSHAKPTRVGYVVKQYPRYSETFIVNEILAHEAVGLPIDIISTRRSSDGNFQDCLARVRACVHYLPSEHPKAQDFWIEFDKANMQLPGLSESLEVALKQDARDVYQAIHLAYHALSRDITHLHAHFATAATTVARLAARFARLPFTFTAHAKDIFHNSVNPDDLRQKLEEAAAVVTVSDFNREFLRGTYGSAANRVQRIYNGLDLDEFQFSSPQHRPPKIVAVGRLVEKKGFKTLIEACAILARNHQHFRCEIVGTGVLDAPLRAQIEQLGLDRIVHMPGPRPQAELSHLIQEAAVFAVPCVVAADHDRDGLPTVLLEAMALGTPCISTDVTGIPEVVRNGDTGILVPQGDPIALALAIDRLFDDAALRVSLATNARRLVESRFDVRRNASQMRDLFRSVTYPEACSEPALREAV